MRTADALAALPAELIYLDHGLVLSTADDGFDLVAAHGIEAHLAAPALDVRLEPAHVAGEGADHAGPRSGRKTQLAVTRPGRIEYRKERGGACRRTGSIRGIAL